MPCRGVADEQAHPILKWRGQTDSVAFVLTRRPRVTGEFVHQASTRCVYDKTIHTCQCRMGADVNARLARLQIQEPMALGLGDASALGSTSCACDRRRPEDPLPAVADPQEGTWSEERTMSNPNPIVGSACLACGVAIRVASPAEHAQAWRSHRCEGEIKLPYDLLRRLMLAAERHDVGEILDVQSELAKHRSAATA